MSVTIQKLGAQLDALIPRIEQVIEEKHQLELKLAIRDEQVSVLREHRDLLKQQKAVLQEQLEQAKADAEHHRLNYERLLKA